MQERREIEDRLERKRGENLTFFFEPYPWQLGALGVVREKSIVPCLSSNKIGKTAFGCNVVISWVLGYEPWNYVDESDEDAVEVEGYFYRNSSLGIEPPVDIVITGEDWKMHIGQTLIRELKKWSPKGWYTTKKNEQGIQYLWEWFNGSTFTLMCYTQDDSLFESSLVHGVWADEPIPRSKYVGLARGLMLTGGKTLLTLTPLKQAWLLDEFVLSERDDIGVVSNLKITDNTDLYEHDVLELRRGGLTDEQVEEFFNKLLWDSPKNYVSDRGRRAKSYLRELTDLDLKLKILKFVEDIDPSDVGPRLFGEFKSLVGRILKNYDSGVHLVEPFEVPTDWPVVVMIDVHLSKPQAISYWAVNKQDVHYCIKETWENLSAEEVADSIIRSKKVNTWNIENVFIDPLSKGDSAYMRNMLGSDIKDSFTIINERLGRDGMVLRVASKDKDSGIRNIQSYLKGVNGLATCYLFNNLERHIYEILRWVYDDDGKPTKDSDDHFMENWYRYTLTGSNYSDSVRVPLPAMPDRHWMSL